MSLKATIRADVDRVFLNTNDFAELISYTPAGGIARTIKAIPETQIEIHFMDVGHVDLAFERRAYWISAIDDTKGVITPKLHGKYGDAGGDRVTLTEIGDVRTWLVKQMKTVKHFHLILIVDNAAAR